MQRRASEKNTELGVDAEQMSIPKNVKERCVILCGINHRLGHEGRPHSNERRALYYVIDANPTRKLDFMRY